MTNPANIFAAASIAATVAAHDYDDAIGIPETQRGFDCGFAWVTVRPARGKFVAWCKANGHGRTGTYGGWEFWNPSKHPTQTIGTKEAGAQAFARVLLENGISASVGSRLD